MEKLEKLLPKQFKVTLIFRGSQHGFKSQTFHTSCDHQGPTLTILKSEIGKVFGAYTDIAWENSDNYKNGNGNSFVFSLRDDFNFVKLKCLNKNNEVYHNASYLTMIGYSASGFDIYNDCNINTSSCSNLGYNG